MPVSFVANYRGPILVLVAMIVAAHPAGGLIVVGKGNSPIPTPGFGAPPGSLAVANLKTRVAWTEGPPFGGGQWTFYYRGTTEQLQETLDTFSGIEGVFLEVALHAGRGDCQFLDDTHFDWSFEVWDPGSWDRLFNNPENFAGTDSPNCGKPAPGPRLDVWLWKEGPDWSKIKVPAKVTVRDERATAHGFPPGSGLVVRVDVTDYQGKAISGAGLQITADANLLDSVCEAVTDRQGTLTVTGIPAGSHRISVMAPGFAPRLVAYLHSGSDDYQSYAVKLAPVATLSGSVMDGEGKPLGNVTVQPMGAKGPDGAGYPMPEKPRATSDESGHFLLSGVPVGTLQLQARLQGYHYQWDPKNVMKVRGDGQPGEGACVLTMVPTGTLRVRVVDPQGKPFKSSRPGDMHVNIQEAGRTGIGSWGGGAAVDDQGTCEFKDVPPGRYRLSEKPFLPGDGKSHNTGEVVVTVTARNVTEATLIHGAP